MPARRGSEPSRTSIRFHRLPFVPTFGSVADRLSSARHSWRMRLAPLLVPTDLPIAELCAARLDGELYGVDAAFAPVDTPFTTHTRAAALGAWAHGRLIAEQHTAAWVWGALSDPPERHEFCARIDRRTRPPFGSAFSVREVVIDESEIAHLAGMRVTSPLRTVIDLVRFTPQFTTRDAQIVRELRSLQAVTAEQCERYLDARPHLPNKRQATQRLALSS
jgi:hypothetical protein